MFQLQGPSAPGPIVGLESAGSSGSFSFDVTVPEDVPVFGKLIINDPPSLAREYGPAITWHDLYYDTRPRYAPGENCNAAWGDCTDLDSCFGARLGLMEPVTANLQVVSAGGSENPSFGCGALDGFVPGRIAVIRRGECSFFPKAYYAQAAGATGAILVNDGRCNWLGPDSPDCVLPMNGGGAAFLVDIPVVMLSSRDGEALIAELAGGGTVTATMGAVPGGGFHVSAEIFSTDVNEHDPNPTNNGDAQHVAVGEFIDGFDCGDCSGWTMVWDK
jgi:hypothetical protein